MTILSTLEGVVIVYVVFVMNTSYAMFPLLPAGLPRADEIFGRNV